MPEITPEIVRAAIINKLEWYYDNIKGANVDCEELADDFINALNLNPDIQAFAMNTLIYAPAVQKYKIEEPFGQFTTQACLILKTNVRIYTLDKYQENLNPPESEFL